MPCSISLKALWHTPRCRCGHHRPGLLQLPVQWPASHHRRHALCRQQRDRAWCLPSMYGILVFKELKKRIKRLLRLTDGLKTFQSLLNSCLTVHNFQTFQNSCLTVCMMYCIDLLVLVAVVAVVGIIVVVVISGRLWRPPGMKEEYSRSCVRRRRMWRSQETWGVHSPFRETHGLDQ